jgi:hypothetical protein
LSTDVKLDKIEKRPLSFLIRKMADPELVMLKFECLNTRFDKLYDLFKAQINLYNGSLGYNKKVLHEQLVYQRHMIYNEYDRLRNIWKIIDYKWRDAIREDISRLCVQTNYGLDYGENLYLNKRPSSDAKSRLDIRILAVYEAMKNIM